MKHQLSVVIAVFSVSMALSAALAPLLAPRESSTVIDGEYIVVFNKETSSDEVAEHKSAVFPTLSNSSMILHEYNIGTEFRGYAARMTQDEVQKVRTMPNVRYVEKNQIAEINDEVSCKMQSSATWGLVRTTRRAWPPHYYSYLYGSDGQGVDVYVIDSGIEVEHPDFEDRATWGADFTEGAYNYVDENGHGTHVAGTIMGRKYGVAKKATAIAVRVLGASGRGSLSTVIRGITHVVNHFNPSKSTVVNMSLGGGTSRSEDDAVKAAISRGIHFAVSAGNDGSNACYKSPARVPEAVTVAASDAQDMLASFSNYGQCVDIIGPGVDITSNWIGNRVKTISGTSMATPHVAGVMAKVLSEKPYYTPAQLKHYLLRNATQDQVSGLTGMKWQTPNKLLYGRSC